MCALKGNSSIAEKLQLPIDAWKLVSNGKIELIQLHLKKGEGIEKHSNDVDVVFYVLEGEGHLTLENTTQLLTVGDCIQVEKGIPRAWKNTSSTRTKILVVKIFY